MSEYERNKGKLTPINVPIVDGNYLAAELNEYADTQIADVSKYYDSSTQALMEAPTEYGHALIDGIIYKFEESEVMDQDPEYCHVTKNDDGSFDFESYHYNGGAHWTELLEGKLL